MARDRDVPSRIPPDENRRSYLRYLREKDKEALDVLALLYAALAAAMAGGAGADGRLDLIDLRGLENRVNGTFRVYTARLADVATGGLRRVIDLGEQTMLDTMRAQLGATQAGRLLRGYDSVGGQTQSYVAEMGTRHEPLADWIQRVAGDARSKVLREVRTGIVQGEQATNVTKRIRGVITGEVAGGGQRPKESLAVNVPRAIETEYAGAFAEAQKRVAGKFKDVLVGFRWWLSDRHVVPDICDRYSGQLLRLGSKDLLNFPPHPNCQCFLQPVWEKASER